MGQVDKVRDYMLSKGDFVSLAEIADATGYTTVSIPAISARIRDLRKPKFGSYQVVSTHLGGGLWVYKLQQPVQQTQEVAA